ncbi:response regulator [Paenibacillus sp. J5C_2022]|uniref:response regulator transcription factor n=1 Tax=Paenibacillus sp. J5C2022 TaxID=2977129 RepID=UPI0021D3C6C9|nr:response regulator [Paenibacillus sp. J5C2022]MCU6713127.1 response regulator [Paenibacillus sp. J5C2022]
MYKVLLVDDERWIVESLKKALDWEGYGFRIAGEAYNGLDAYDRIAKLQPDLAFVDIRMPGMNGLELIQKVKEQDYAIEMVVASGHAEFEYACKAMNSGAAGYCVKPFHRGELADVVQRIKTRLDKQSGQMQEQRGAGKEGLQEAKGLRGTQSAGQDAAVRSADQQQSVQSADLKAMQREARLPEQLMERRPVEQMAGLQVQQASQLSNRLESGVQVQRVGPLRGMSSNQQMGPSGQWRDQRRDQGPGKQEKQGNPQLREILRYLEENYHRNITVQSVSKRFYMHPNYLSQLFKKEMKTNFTQYVTAMRMECAQRLLRESALPVSDIAERTGYRDYFYFARTFKKHTGMTPTAYRDARY